MRAAIIAGVTPLLLLVAGLVLLAVGIGVLRTFGSRFRVGRLLAATPIVPVSEAVALASAARRYVGVRGRVDAEDEFEDDAHRPLVFRRTRLERRDGTRWTTFDDERQAVPFELRQGQDAIGVDAGALDSGLVVVARESVGSAADVPDRLPGAAPSTPVRMRVEQVSSVEHAIALGVPERDPSGRAWLAAGLGRPLVLTTLDAPDAIRVLAEGRTRRPLVAALCLGAGLVFVTIGLAWMLLEAIA